MNYGTIQLAIWWLSHIILSWWKIKSPFHFREYAVYHKYVHIGCVLIGILLPFLQPIVTLTVGARDDMRSMTQRYGYIITSHPPTTCLGVRHDVTIYTNVLPFSIILAIGTSFLLMTFWLIHKVKSAYNICMNTVVVMHVFKSMLHATAYHMCNYNCVRKCVPFCSIRDC